MPLTPAPDTHLPNTCLLRSPSCQESFLQEPTATSSAKTYRTNDTSSPSTICRSKGVGRGITLSFSAHRGSGQQLSGEILRSATLPSYALPRPVYRSRELSRSLQGFTVQPPNVSKATCIDKKYHNTELMRRVYGFQYTLSGTTGSKNPRQICQQRIVWHGILLATFSFSGVRRSRSRGKLGIKQVILLLYDLGSTQDPSVRFSNSLTLG